MDRRQQAESVIYLQTFSKNMGDLMEFKPCKRACVQDETVVTENDTADSIGLEEG